MRDKTRRLLESMTDDVADARAAQQLPADAVHQHERGRSLERIDETARLINELERPDCWTVNSSSCRTMSKSKIARRANRVYATGARRRPELREDRPLRRPDRVQRDARGLPQIDPQRYFPEVLRRRYADLIPGHRLSPQILATLIANDIVNRMGPGLHPTRAGRHRRQFVTIARAYTSRGRSAGPVTLTDDRVRSTTRYRRKRADLDDVRGQPDTASCLLLAHRAFRGRLQIEPPVDRLKDGMTTVYTRTGAAMSPAAKERHERRCRASRRWAFPTSSPTAWRR